MANADWGSFVKDDTIDNTTSNAAPDWGSFVDAGHTKQKLADEKPVRDWLRSTYSGTQRVDQIEITPALRARYERSKIKQEIGKPIEEYYHSLGGIDNPITAIGVASQTAEDTMRSPVTVGGNFVEGTANTLANNVTNLNYGLNKLFGKKYGQGVRPLGVPDEIVAAPKETGLNKIMADTASGLESVGTAAGEFAKRYGIDETRHPEIAKLLGGTGKMMGELAPYMAVPGIGAGILPVSGAVSSAANAIKEGGRYGSAGKVIGAAAEGAEYGALDAAIFHGAGKLIPAKWGKVASALGANKLSPEQWQKVASAGGFATVHELNRDLQEGRITAPNMDTVMSAVQAFLIPAGKESRKARDARELWEIKQKNMEDFSANQERIKNEWMARTKEEKIADNNQEIARLWGKYPQEQAQNVINESQPTTLVPPVPSKEGIIVGEMTPQVQPPVAPEVVSEGQPSPQAGVAKGNAVYGYSVDRSFQNKPDSPQFYLTDSGTPYDNSHVGIDRLNELGIPVPDYPGKPSTPSTDTQKPTISTPVDQTTLIAPEGPTVMPSEGREKKTIEPKPVEEKPVEPKPAVEASVPPTNDVQDRHSQRVVEKAREIGKTENDLQNHTFAEIVDSEVATHPEKNLREHAEMAVDFVERNPEWAQNIRDGKKGTSLPDIMGKDGLPLTDVEIWLAGANHAIETGNGAELLKYSKGPIVDKISQAASTLNTLSLVDPSNPLYQIMAINKEGKATGKRIKRSPEQVKAINDRIFSLEQQIRVQGKKIEQFENKKAINTFKYEIRKKGRVRAKAELDAEFKDIASILQKELSSQMNVGLDPKHIKMFAQLAINRVEKGMKTIEQVVDYIHKEIGGVIDKRLIRDTICGYGKTAKLSKDEIDIDFRDVKHQGRLVSAIEDALKGKSPLHSGLQRDPDSPTITGLKKQLKEAMIKEGFAIDAQKLSDQWDALNESGSGKKLFASQEDHLMSLMDRYRKHLIKREADLRKKIDGNEYTNNPKAKLQLDKQMQETKDRIDRLAKEYKNKFSEQYDNLNEMSNKKQIAIDMAKENKQLAEQYASLNEKSIKKSFPAEKKAVSPEDQESAIMARFKKHLEKRENELNHRLLSGDYETGKSVKDKLDNKLDIRETMREHVDRMSKALKNFKQIKEITEHGMTIEDAGNLISLSKDVSNKKKFVTDWNDRSSDGPALEYGRAAADYFSHVADLKLKLQTRSWAEIKGHIKAQPVVGTLQETGLGILKAGGISKSILSSMDDSALGRQGIKVFWNDMLTGNHTWRRSALQSFKDLVNQFKGKDVMREVQADVLSRPNMINGRYISGGQFGKLNFSNIEEAFPEQAHERLPGIGRAFKASDVAFTAFQYRTRADTADYLFKVAEKLGSPLEKEQIGGICQLANSLTGRGNVKSSRTLNNLFFSPKFLKSNFEFLTDPLNQNRTPFVRQEALKALGRYALGTISVGLIAHAIMPKAVELDPASADWGKIKIGNTRFDFTGGIGPMITLTRRLGTALVSTVGQIFGGKPLPAMKSSTTGKYSALTTGKGFQKTGQDVVNQFVAGKLSPAAGLIYRQGLTGVDINRKPLKVGNVLLSMIVPLIIQDVIEALKNDNAASVGLIFPADFFGIGVNTYGDEKKKPNNVQNSNTNDVSGWGNLVK